MKIQHQKIIQVFAIIFVTYFSFNTARANDGEKLFRQNCTSCHKIDEALIGPALKGVKAKWEAAGELDNLALWVQNPRGLYESNKSEMAKIAWDIKPIEMMGISHLSEDDILAIFDHVDAEKIPKPPVGPPETETGNKLTPEELAELKRKQQNRNRAVFLFLVIGGIMIIVGISSISKAIEVFCLSDKNKPPRKKKKRANGGIIIGILLALLIPFKGFSFSFNLDNVEEGWLIISNTDNVVFFIVDLVLLLILYNQYKVLQSIIAESSYAPKEEVEEEETIDVAIIKALTGAVPIEEEEAIILDHDYDGIKELDNNLPPWWVWGFVASIIFAIFYMVHYHVTGTGDLQIAEYDKTVAAAQVEVDEYMDAMAMNVDENNVTLLEESKGINNGKELFSINCVVCHKANGEGLVGPNLTDKYWINGDGSIQEVFKMIKYGNAKGMPEHESKLNPIELQQVASYVLTMEYHEGKAPEGELIEK